MTPDHSSSPRKRKTYGPTETPPDVIPTTTYSVCETARKLDIHRNSVRNHFLRGTLRAIDPTAKELRFRGSEIQRWWRIHRQQKGR